MNNSQVKIIETEAASHDDAEEYARELVAWQVKTNVGGPLVNLARCYLALRRRALKAAP